MYLHQIEAAPKLGLIKAKVALVKAPHVIAKVAVAKEVKSKAKVALAESFAAVSFILSELRIEDRSKLFTLFIHKLLDT